MVTMKDIAKASGVSRAVVSLVLNGRERQVGIADSTRTKVLAVAEEIGYCRNELARAVVTGCSRVVALVTPVSIGGHEYISRIMGGISDELSDRGYSLKIFYLKDHNEAQIVRKIRENQVAGVICHAVRHQELEILRGELLDLRIPCVTVNLSADKFGIGVVSNDAAGIERAVDYLYECGHRRIAYFGSNGDAEYIQNRNLGFKHGIEKHGLEERYFHVAKTGKFPDKFYVKADKMYEEGFRAVVSETDAFAAILMQWAYVRNVRIPDELSIIGFSDAYFSNICVVPLTTVAQPLDTLGNVAAKHLIDWIESKSEKEFSGISNIVIPVDLTVRSTVKRV